MLGLAPTAPDLLSIGEADASTFAQERLAYIQGEIFRPDISPAAKAMYRSAADKFQAFLDKVGSSWWTTWGGMERAERDVLLDAEDTLQKAVVTAAAVLSPEETVLQPADPWGAGAVRPLPWWAWVGVALLVAGYFRVGPAAGLFRRGRRRNPGRRRRRKNPCYVRRVGPLIGGQRRVLGPYSLSSALTYGRLASGRSGRERTIEVTCDGSLVRRYRGGKATYRAPGTEHPLGGGRRKRR